MSEGSCHDGDNDDDGLDEAIPERSEVGSTERGAGEEIIRSVEHNANMRIYLTACLCLTFFSLGLANSLLGPTFIHLTYLFNTDISTLAIGYTFGNIAYLLGSLFCGIFFDKFNAELQFAITTLLMGISAGLCPWSPNVYAFYGIYAIQNFAMGFIDASGQSYIICLWNDHRFKEPVMQTAHGIWSLGATICPFIVLPFLCDIPAETFNDMSSVATLTEMDTNISLSVTTTVGTTALSDFQELETVRYAYALVGVLIIIFSLCFCVGFFKEKPSLFRQKGSAAGPPAESNKNKFESNFGLYITTLGLIGLFYFAYTFYEMIPGNYFSAFVIDGLDWESRKGALITSIFWGFQGFGRLIAIPVSMVVSPGKMLTWSMALTTLAYGLMLFIPVTGELIVWFSAALSGFSLSSIFATMVLWTSNHIHISGKVGAIMLIGGSLGGSFGGALAGYLLEEYTHMWMVYLSLMGCAVDIVIYVLLHVLVKFKSDNHSGVESGLVVTVGASPEELEPMKLKS